VLHGKNKITGSMCWVKDKYMACPFERNNMMGLGGVWSFVIDFV
jgi:hypothetical protein